MGLSSAGIVALALAACEDSSFSESPGDSSMLDANGGRGSSPNDARIDRPPSDAFELDASGGAAGDALSDDSNADPPDSGPRVDASNDARPPMDASNDARDANPPPCRSITDCPMGQNCATGRCVAAQVSCAAQKSSYPASADGVYWIAPAAVPYRAYCDMAISAELCTEIEGEHRGRTRDKAAIAYLMKSILLSSDGTCRIWALRGAEGYPLTFLRPVNGVPEAATCPALGFVADGVLGSCPYGARFGDCGFGTSPLHLWGNYCAGCAVNEGAYDRYVLQGPIDTGIVLSSVQGNVFTTCRVR